MLLTCALSRLRFPGDLQGLKTLVEQILPLAEKANARICLMETAVRVIYMLLYNASTDAQRTNKKKKLRNVAYWLGALQSDCKISF